LIVQNKNFFLKTKQKRVHILANPTLNVFHKTLKTT
jgi:hypothetical protein